MLFSSVSRDLLPRFRQFHCVNGKGISRTSGLPPIEYRTHDYAAPKVARQEMVRLAIASFEPAPTSH